MPGSPNALISLLRFEPAPTQRPTRSVLSISDLWQGCVLGAAGRPPSVTRRRSSVANRMRQPSTPQHRRTGIVRGITRRRRGAHADEGPGPSVSVLAAPPAPHAHALCTRRHRTHDAHTHDQLLPHAALPHPSTPIHPSQAATAHSREPHPAPPAGGATANHRTHRRTQQPGSGADRRTNVRRQPAPLWRPKPRGCRGVGHPPPAITVSAAHALRPEPPLPTRCTHHPKHRCTRQRPSDDGATPTSPQASPPSRQASQSHRLSPSATS